MAITKTAGYASSDGVVHASLFEAQCAEMLALLKTIDGTGMIYPAPGSSLEVNATPEAIFERIADDLVNHSDAILAILTTGPRSRPKARKAGGTTNPKRAARKAVVDEFNKQAAIAARAVSRATEQQVKEGIEAMREAVDASSTPTT